MDSLNNYNEDDILLLVAKGDELAFGVLFDRWHPLLASYIFRITESKENTEEIIQDVFLKIWMAREALSEIQNFKHYLFIACRNRAFDVMKKHLREQKNKRLLEIEIERKSQGETEFDLFTANLIDQAIDSLPPRRKEVYLLSRHERLTYQEIANQLDISRESVKTHLKLATDSISKFIKANLNIITLMLTFIKKM